MDNKWKPQCACGEKFENMADFRAHLIREGGSQSHTLFCAMRPIINRPESERDERRTRR